MTYNQQQLDVIHSPLSASVPSPLIGLGPQPRAEHQDVAAAPPRSRARRWRHASHGTSACCQCCARHDSRPRSNPRACPGPGQRRRDQGPRRRAEVRADVPCHRLAASPRDRQGPAGVLGESSSSVERQPTTRQGHPRWARPLPSPAFPHAAPSFPALLDAGANLRLHGLLTIKLTRRAPRSVPVLDTWTRTSSESRRRGRRGRKGERRRGGGRASKTWRPGHAGGLCLLAFAVTCGPP